METEKIRYRSDCKIVLPEKLAVLKICVIVREKCNGFTNLCRTCAERAEIGNRYEPLRMNVILGKTYHGQSG